MRVSHELMKIYHREVVCRRMVLFSDMQPESLRKPQELADNSLACLRINSRDGGERLTAEREKRRWRCFEMKGN
jgi:hypothetical protein